MKKIAALIALAVGVLLTGACEIEDPAAVQPAEREAGKAAEQDTKAAGAKKRQEEVPVRLAAKPAKFVPGPISSGAPHSCAKVTITNQTDGRLDINPLYFSITGTDGEKHTGTNGEAEGEFEMMALAPGEKATGVVCGKGKFRPGTVTFNKDGFGTSYRAEVGS